MRTLSLAILAAVLVYGLPSSASAQTNPSTVCPPGQFKRNGVCVDRPRMGPGTNPGRGEDLGLELPDYFYGTCQGIANWSMVNCGGTNTGPYPNVRRPPGH